VRLPEQRLWDYLRRGMAGRWDAQRHEDRLAVGVPDLSYGCGGADGWIEMKAASRWPARESTPLRVELRPGQRAWLAARARAGSGRCWILLRVGSGRSADHLLVPVQRLKDLPGRTGRWTPADGPAIARRTLTRTVGAAEVVLAARRDWEQHLAAHAWRGGIVWNELEDALCRGAR